MYIYILLLLCVHIVMMIHECPNTRAASGQCHVRVALLASPLVLSHWTFGAWYTKGWLRDVLSSQPWTFQAWSLCFRLSSTWETRPFAGAGTLGAATLCAATEPIKQLTAFLPIRRMENPWKSCEVDLLQGTIFEFLRTLGSHSPACWRLQS